VPGVGPDELREIFVRLAQEESLYQDLSQRNCHPAQIEIGDQSDLSAL